VRFLINKYRLKNSLPIRIIIVISFIAIFFAIVNEFILAGQRLVSDSRSLDFAAFYTGAAMLDHFPGARLYALSLQLSRQHEIAPMMDVKNYPQPFFNPPFFALLFWPLTRLSLGGAYAAWAVINSALLILLGYFATLHLSRTKFQKVRWLLLIIGMFIFAPIIVTLLIGQVSILITFLFFLCWTLLKKNREFSSGLVLSLVLIKLQFILLPVFVFMVQRRYRVVGGILSGITLLFLLSIVLIGWQGLLNYLALLTSLSIGELSGIYKTDLQSQYTLQTSLMILFRTQTPSAIRMLWIITDTVLILLTCVVWAVRPPLQSIEFDLQWILLILATLLTSPHTHFYDLSLLIVPFIVILNIIQSLSVDFKKLLHIPPNYVVALLSRSAKAA
jgi:hypothetical protein